MNNDLTLWDGTLLLPTSFDQARLGLERLKGQQLGPNPIFLALTQALQSQPTVDAGWVQALAERARRLPDTVWNLSLPADGLVQTLQAVVHQATALGLVVFSEPLGMVFLPGGGVLPPNMQSQWAELTAHLQASPPLNKTEVTQLTATLMREQLAPHGFVPRRIEDECDAQFVRPTRDGYQSVLMRVIDDSPFPRCVVRCGHRSEEVENIFEQIFGPAIRIPWTFWFNPSIFVGASGGDLPIENSAGIRAVLGIVERYGMPPLDLAREPGGLDRLMNEPQRFPFSFPNLHPQAARNLADEYVSAGRNLCLKTLIVAWQARNPAFENRVADLRKFVVKRVDVSEKDLSRVVDHLRAMPA
jgi:hypothetical protein